MSLNNALTIKHARILTEVSEINDDSLQGIVDRIHESSDQCKTCEAPRLPLDVFLKLNWLPDPTPRADDESKFMSFDEVYGTNTEEMYRPSYIVNLDEPLKQLFTKERAIDVIKCVTCSKPRVIYGEKKVWKEHVARVMRMKEVTLLHEMLLT